GAALLQDLLRRLARRRDLRLLLLQTRLLLEPGQSLLDGLEVGVTGAAGQHGEPGGTGYADRLLNLFSALALNAGWLYAGTLAACAVAAVRKVLLLGDRAARRAQQAQRTAASV
ncbi:DUF6542 domain-containing protein, partial [Streptomyces sp. Ru87]|uniref:DUF6542 domain-containing protein n=1 Tax=Streptomyces sp. Ru87 TaxID=2044307 RepID=UPI000C011A32